MGSRWSRFSCWTCLTADDVYTVNQHFTTLFRNAIYHGERLEALEAQLRLGIRPVAAVGLGAAQTARQGAETAAPPEYEQFKAVLDRLDGFAGRLDGFAGRLAALEACLGPMPPPPRPTDGPAEGVVPAAPAEGREAPQAAI